MFALMKFYLKKLVKLVIEGNALNWFKSYLINEQIPKSRYKW
jgi:hypothetical protein